MCFSLSFIESLLIDLVVIAVVVAILRLLVPWILGQIGFNAPPIMRVIDIIVWAIVIIFVIVVVFDLLRCVVGGGGFPLLPH
jgi:hypothetical protein